METRVLSLDDLLRERQRWCVPVYQRHYACDAGDDGQLTRLWEDIEEKVDEFPERRDRVPSLTRAALR